MFKKFAILIILFALTSSILCRFKDIPDERIFDLDKINGESFLVQKDQEFAVLLRGNPSTGYQWFLAEEIQEDEGLVSLNLNIERTTKKFLELTTEENRMGLGKTYIFTFMGKRAGTYPLVFVHRRSWEKEAVSTRGIKITVSEK